VSRPDICPTTYAGQAMLLRCRLLSLPLALCVPCTGTVRGLNYFTALGTVRSVYRYGTWYELFHCPWRCAFRVPVRYVV